MVPNKKVVWLVTESQLNFIEDKNEWTGTKISFGITEKYGQTMVTFTHHGISPQVECYDACNGAWTNLIGQSLVKFITTGESQQIALD
jgi:predicted lipoprotein with Yx(FWY)xxD motif